MSDQKFERQSHDVEVWTDIDPSEGVLSRGYTCSCGTEGSGDWGSKRAGAEARSHIRESKSDG